MAKDIHGNEIKPGMKLRWIRDHMGRDVKQFQDCRAEEIINDEGEKELVVKGMFITHHIEFENCRSEFEIVE